MPSRRKRAEKPAPEVKKHTFMKRGGGVKLEAKKVDKTKYKRHDDDVKKHAFLRKGEGIQHAVGAQGHERVYRPRSPQAKFDYLRKGKPWEYEEAFKRGRRKLRMAVVGMPNAGKSTTFNFLAKATVATAPANFTTKKVAHAQLYVPDPRFEKLVGTFNPKG